MNYLKPLTCLCALAVSGFASADVTLNLPEGVDLLVVNGEAAETSGGFFSSTKSATLPDGTNQIVFRYEQYFTSKNDSVSVESDAIIATFDAQNSTLNIEVPHYRDAKQAEKQIEDLQWSLVSDNGTQVSVKQDKLIKKGMQIGRDYVRETELYNRDGGIAAVAFATGYATAVTAPAIQVQAVQTQPAPASTDSTAEEMLYFWYNKADQETRDRFKAFVNQQ